MNRLYIPNTCQVPNVLLDKVMPTLNAAALKVLLAIARLTYGFGKPSDKISVSQLQRVTGLSRQGVVSGVKALGNLITIKRGARGAHVQNEYSLNLDIKTGELVNIFDQSKKLTSQKTHRKLVNKVDSPKPIISKPIKREAKGEPSLDLSFTHFYENYPRHRAKDAARRAWRKLNPSPELQKTIFDGLEKQKAHYKGLKDSGEFAPEWPYPGAWLNGKRWEDEIEPKPNGNGHAPVVKDLGDGWLEVDGKRMTEETYRIRRYEPEPRPGA